jgi:hypothetical protein
MSVTNLNDANIALFSLTSGGADYDITLPFEADSIEWWNYTKYATNSQNLQGIWFNGMPSGDALIISRGTTDLSSVLETTEGVIELGDGSGFTETNVTPTAINTTTSVVTVAANTFTEGQFVRGTNFRALPVASATGCYGLNNRVFQIGAVTGTTFELLEPYTSVKADLTGETAFVNNGVAKFNLIGQALYTENPEPVWEYTLGTAIMGNDGDVIYIRAIKANAVTELGDIGA